MSGLAAICGAARAGNLLKLTAGDDVSIGDANKIVSSRRVTQ